MAGHGDEMAAKGLRRAAAVVVLGLTLAGAASAQAAPPASAPGAAHAVAALSHHAGGDTGHRVH